MIPIIAELKYKIQKSCTVNVASHVITKQLIIFQYGWVVSVLLPWSWLSTSAANLWKVAKKTIVLNVFNNFKRMYEFRFKKIRLPYTSKWTRHRCVVTVLKTCMCHKHLAPMAEGYITQFLFTLANQRLTKAHGFVDIRIVVPLNIIFARVGREWLITWARASHRGKFSRFPGPKSFSTILRLTK